LSNSSIDYLKRITDENKLLFLCDALLKFFSELDQNEYQARVAMVKLTYIYYKNDSIYERIKSRLGTRSNENIYFISNSREVIADLVSLVHKWGTPK